MLPEFENLIHDLSAEGGFHDDAAQPIPLEQAEQLYAPFSHEDDNEWSSLLVQFVVAQGGRDITITLGRDHSVFKASMPRHWKAPDLAHTMTEGPGGAHESEQDLFLALCQLSLALQFDFYCELGDYSYSYSEGRLSRRDREHGTSTSMIVDVRHEQTSQQRQIQAGLLRWLTLKAYMCPISMEVDGLRIDRIRPTEKCLLLHYGAVESDTAHWRLPSLIDMTQVLPRGGVGAARLVPHGLPPIVSTLWMISGVFSYEPDSGELSFPTVSQSRLHWVRHGCLAETVDLSLESPEGLLLEIFAPVLDLKIGLDGKLVRDENYEARFREITARVSEEAARVEGKPVYTVFERKKSRTLNVLGLFKLQVGGSSQMPEEVTDSLAAEFQARYEIGARKLQKVYGVRA